VIRILRNAPLEIGGTLALASPAERLYIYPFCTVMRVS
jgi:hypothetical protein